jgi:hypothetical protein
MYVVFSIVFNFTWLATLFRQLIVAGWAMIFIGCFATPTFDLCILATVANAGITIEGFLIKISFK